MNISEYLTNPMGKGSSVLMLSSMRQELDKQYEQLSDRISVKWYSVKNKTYIAHIKIPSRKHERLFYDVVLQFVIDPANTDIKVISYTEMQVFSNCPSFTYTYAYVFNEKGYLIDWTKAKYNKQVLRKSPDTRNPNEILSYERSLYLACKYIMSNKRNFISHIVTVAASIGSQRHLLSSIKTNDEIETLYKEYSTTSKNNKPEKETKKNVSQKTSKVTKQNQKNTETKGKVKTTSYVKKTTKTKSTNKTKRI